MGIFNFFKRKNKNSSNEPSKLDKILQSQAEFELKHELENEYYNKFDKAVKLEKTGELDKALEIYMDIITNYSPEADIFYERPAIMLEKNRDYKRALSIALLGKQNLINQSLNSHGININYFDKRISRLEDKIKNPPKPMIMKKSTPIISKEIIPPELHKFNIDNWNISISFGKSSSSNYDRAVFLAKESPNYYEDGQDKSIVHQATYSSSVNDYLAFIKLYKLVGNWKSCFVFINGELTDKKIIGKLNYCYGDKCRSGNCKFCYGASDYTENPFGCHRLQISKYNHPWWSFGTLDSKKIWHIDKKAILDRINQNYTPYKNCPSFSYENVLYVLNNLPDTIDYRKDKNWCIIDGYIYPKDDNSIIKLLI